MQVSLNWLNEFVDISNIEPAQIAHELTMSGLEVEAVEEVKPMITNIKTVKIFAILFAFFLACLYSASSCIFNK